MNEVGEQFNVDLTNLPSFLHQLHASLVELRGLTVNLQASISDVNTDVKNLRASHERGLSDIENLRSTSTALSDRMTNMGRSIDADVRANLVILNGDVKDHSSRIDGLCGLTNRHDADIVDLSTRLAAMDKRAADVLGAVASCASESRQSTRVSSEATAMVGTLSVKLDTVAELVRDAEEQLEKKYNSVHALVTDTLEKIEKNCQNERGAFRSGAEKQTAQDSTNREITSLVQSTQKLLASAKLESHKSRTKQNVLFQWHYECVRTGYKRVAVRSLRQILLRRIGNMFNSVRYYSMVVGVHDLLSREVERCTNIANSVVEKSGLAERISLFEETVTALMKLTGGVDELRSKVSAIVHEQEVKFVEIDDRISSFENKLQEYLAAHDAAIHTIKDGLPNVIVQPVEKPIEPSTKPEVVRTDDPPSESRFMKYASIDQVQSILTDVLLLWNNVKQLDSTKASLMDLRSSNVELKHSLHDSLKCELGKCGINECLEKLELHQSAIESIRIRIADLAPLTGKIDATEQPRLNHGPQTETLITQPVAMERRQSDRSATVDQFMQYARSILTSTGSERSMIAPAKRPNTASAKRSEQPLEARGNGIRTAGGWGMSKVILSGRKLA